MQLFHVEGESVKQNLGENLVCAAPLQAAKMSVFLEYAEGAFGLDRAVESQQDALLAGDALPGRFPVLFKRPGDFDLPGLLRLRALLPVRTSDRKSTRLNSSHNPSSRMPSSA